MANGHKVVGSNPATANFFFCREDIGSIPPAAETLPGWVGVFPNQANQPVRLRLDSMEVHHDAQYDEVV